MAYTYSTKRRKNRKTWILYIDIHRYKYSYIVIRLIRVIFCYIINYKRNIPIAMKLYKERSTTYSQWVLSHSSPFSFQCDCTEAGVRQKMTDTTQSVGNSSAATRHRVEPEFERVLAAKHFEISLYFHYGY